MQDALSPDHAVIEVEQAPVVCPVGVPGIAGKEPGVIAVAVLAQILALR